MKINEFNDKKRIDELDLGNLVNKLRGHPTMTSTDKRAKDIFLKGFLSKVVGGLDSAIKSNLVSATAATAPTAPTAAPTAATAAPTAATAAPTAPTAAPTAATAAPTAPTAATAAPTAATGGKMTQAQQNAMKAKLQGQRVAGKTTASQTGSGFKNYVAGSEEKMTGVDASGAPVFKKLQRESVELKHTFKNHQYSKLNTIFEGIISLAETPTQQSISQYVMNFTNKYLGNNPGFAQYQPNLQQLAQRVEKEYSRDRGNKALTDLANLVYSMAQTVPHDSTSSNATITGTSQQQAQNPQVLQANQILKNLLANATVQQKTQIIQFLNKANTP